MSDRKALVIGIDKYPERPLRNCVNDATDIHLVLDSKEYSFDVSVLFDEQATRREILKSFNNIFEDEPNFVVIYFAGHGLSNNIGTYLVPVDADDLDLGIDLDYLRRLIISKSRNGRSILLLLDSCHSGAASIRGLIDTKARSITLDDINQAIHSLGSGNVVIAACQPHEVAYEEPSLNHGVFTYYLLEGMYGDAADNKGDITIPNIYDYVSNKFEEITKQRPIFKGDITGRIVLGSNLKPRNRTIIPAEEIKKIEIQAENLMDSYIQSTSSNIESWSREIYKYACTSLLPILQWFEREFNKNPELSKSSKFKSAYATAQNKLADLGHLKEELNTEVGIVKFKLGSGTFGTVWKINNVNFDIAYKVYHPVDLENKEKLSRFTRGYRAMAQLDHPHVVKVHKYTDCPHGFVMDYIDGANLRNIVHIESNPVDILTQLLTVGETLKHAHSRGVIHRDVKPENIIMKFEGVDNEIRYRPYLTDFDLAWFTTATQFTKEGVGSLTYAAPEQLSKPQSNVAHAVTTDVYAFGQLCFFFICRRDPIPLLSDNTRALRESLNSWGLQEPVQKMINLYQQCTQQYPTNRIQDFREICDRVYEISQLIAEYDHQRIIGPDKFIKQLVFSIIGLSPELIFESGFFTKTSQYKIILNCSETEGNIHSIRAEIYAQADPIVDGISNFKEVQRILTKRIDSTLHQYRHIVVRKQGKMRKFEFVLEIKDIKLNTDGVELCRQILMRVINCIEGN